MRERVSRSFACLPFLDVPPSSPPQKTKHKRKGKTSSITCSPYKSIQQFMEVCLKVESRRKLIRFMEKRYIYRIYLSKKKKKIFSLEWRTFSISRNIFQFFFDCSFFPSLLNTPTTWRLRLHKIYSSKDFHSRLLFPAWEILLFRVIFMNMLINSCLSFIDTFYLLSTHDKFSFDYNLRMYHFINWKKKEKSKRIPLRPSSSNLFLRLFFSQIQKMVTRVYLHLAFQKFNTSVLIWTQSNNYSFL